MQKSLFFRRISVVTFCVLLLGIRSIAQTETVIYADTGSDTLKNVIALLRVQLENGGVKQVRVAPKAEYNGKGIYLSNVNSGRQQLPFSTKLKKGGPETFNLSGNQQSIKIFGNSDMAVSHGVFSWLYKLGYRFYFANSDWYIYPRLQNLYGSLDQVSGPSFNHRRIWYGYGTGSAKADKDYDFWVTANRLGGSVNASFGHAYSGIISRNRAAFLAHPEWFYPKAKQGTIPDEPKFDMTQEDLIQLIIADTEREIEISLKNNTSKYKMISLGPSDGVGTCNTPACQALGTVTDRVFYLVNRVAKAISKKYPQTLIGCLAYSEYIAPPTKKIEPNVFVGLTTAFNTSKFSTEQLVSQWSNKGAQVGIYTYFSWYAWDFDIPGQSMASKVPAVVKEIRKYYQRGVRSFEAESSVGWISKGLGYYIASRMLWDVTANPDAMQKEFFSNCFGKAASSMAKLWNEMGGNGYSNVRDADLARWMDYVTDAEQTEGDAAVQRRFYQIKSYLYYLYLYSQYQVTKKEAELKTLLVYGNRMLDQSAVPGYPAFFVLGGGSKIPGMEFSANAKWQGNKSALSREELSNLTSAARGKLKSFAAVKTFARSARMTTIPPNMKRPKETRGFLNNVNSYWYPGEWVMQIGKKGNANFMELSGGYTAGGGGPRPIVVSLYPYSATGDVSDLTPLMVYNYTDSTRAKKKISFEKFPAGTYTVIIDDPVRIYQVDFSDALLYSFVNRPERQLNTAGGDHYYFVVPEGVQHFNLSKSRLVKIMSPAGRLIEMLNDHANEDFQIEVKPGEQGLWKVTYLVGKLYLEGVPPYIGINASQMLVPSN